MFFFHKHISKYKHTWLVCYCEHCWYSFIFACTRLLYALPTESIWSVLQSQSKWSMQWTFRGTLIISHWLRVNIYSCKQCSVNIIWTRFKNNWESCSLRWVENHMDRLTPAITLDHKKINVTITCMLVPPQGHRQILEKSKKSIIIALYSINELLFRLVSISKTTGLFKKSNE